jgi:hypothetical protein
MRRSRTVLLSALVIASFILTGSLASAKGAARKARPGAALEEIEVRLLGYEDKHRWCTYHPRIRAYASGASPFGRFEATSPTYPGRTFGVLLKCTDRMDLLRTLRTGAGRLFVLVLPQHFLRGKYSQIEDCSIDAAVMKRWRPAEADSDAQ